MKISDTESNQELSPPNKPSIGPITDIEIAYSKLWMLIKDTKWNTNARHVVHNEAGEIIFVITIDNFAKWTKGIVSVTEGDVKDLREFNLPFLQSNKRINQLVKDMECITLLHEFNPDSILKRIRQTKLIMKFSSPHRSVWKVSY